MIIIILAWLAKPRLSQSSISGQGGVQLTTPATNISTLRRIAAVRLSVGTLRQAFRVGWTFCAGSVGSIQLTLWGGGWMGAGGCVVWCKAAAVKHSVVYLCQATSVGWVLWTGSVWCTQLTMGGSGHVISENTAATRYTVHIL